MYITMGTAVYGYISYEFLQSSSRPALSGILGMNFLVGRLRGMFLQTVLSWDMFARCA